jgi:DNA-binding NarL/FixJ family response regulator
MSIRIVLVDDHAAFRGCLRDLLQRQDGIEVLGEFDDGDALLQALPRLACSTDERVFVLDLDMQRLSGIETLRQLLARQPHAAVVMLSWHDDQALLQAARDEGCRGFVSKDAPFPSLVQTIREVAAGGSRVGSTLS